MFAASISSSVAKWLVLPVPDEPKLSLPGSLRARAMSSGVVLAGTWLETVSSIGPFATIATGEKPFTGSKGRLGWIAALVVNDDDRRHNVYPSGTARETTAAPMFPPAPGRLSMITGVFHASESFLPSSRANVSFEPPGG